MVKSLITLVMKIVEGFLCGMNPNAIGNNWKAHTKPLDLRIISILDDILVMGTVLE